MAGFLEKEGQRNKRGKQNLMGNAALLEKLCVYPAAAHPYQSEYAPDLDIELLTFFTLSYAKM